MARPVLDVRATDEQVSHARSPQQSSNTQDIPGTCPGDGRCDGTGGSSACAGCPTFNNVHSSTGRNATLNTVHVLTSSNDYAKHPTTPRMSKSPEPNEGDECLPEDGSTRPNQTNSVPTVSIRVVESDTLLTKLLRDRQRLSHRRSAQIVGQIPHHYGGEMLPVTRYAINVVSTRKREEFHDQF
jgi:hypothetical protein